MEENEKELDNTNEEELETSEELDVDDESIDNSYSNDDLSSDEIEKLRKENETLKAQKEHWRKKASQEAKPLQTNKTEISEEQLLKMAQIANSIDSEDLEVLKTIVGESIADKVENPLFKAYKEAKEKKKRSEASALKPSTANFTYNKKSPNSPDLTPEEHRKMVEKLMS